MLNRNDDERSDDPLVLAPVTRRFDGRDAPHGLTWTCLHPACVKRYGPCGFTFKGFSRWSGCVVDQHLSEHGVEHTALIENPESYVGDTPPALELHKALEDRSVMYLHVQDRTWSGTQCASRSFRGLATLRRARAGDGLIIRPLDGSPKVRASYGALRGLRAPFAEEHTDAQPERRVVLTSEQQQAAVDLLELLAECAESDAAEEQASDARALATWVRRRAQFVPTAGD